VSEGKRIAADLRAAIDEGAALFAGASEERTARQPAPDKWSAREVIGHLIDSACNNHRRFIVNQEAQRLAVDPYEQETWVARQGYAETPASELVALWTSYNRHLARVIERIPDAVLHDARGPMGDRRFPYTDLPAGDVATLRHLVEDYVGHLRHHLDQIRSLLAR
jgi:hypothetical protein